MVNHPHSITMSAIVPLVSAVSIVRSTIFTAFVVAIGPTKSSSPRERGGGSRRQVTTTRPIPAHKSMQRARPPPLQLWLRVGVKPPEGIVTGGEGKDWGSTGNPWTLRKTDYVSFTTKQWSNAFTHDHLESKFNHELNIPYDLNQYNQRNYIQNSYWCPWNWSLFKTNWETNTVKKTIAHR